MTLQRPRKPPRLGLDGAVWMTIGDAALGGRERMALLRAVADSGSITRAAQQQGFSYKGAWQAIEAMNAAAREPLVERRAGGRGGGQTRLTPHGERLLARFEQLDAAHRRFVALLAEAATTLDADFDLLKVLNMRTSARNQFVGKVSAIRAGAVNDEVELTLPGGSRLVAHLTPQSTAALGLRTGGTAIALVKSSSVLLAIGDGGGQRLSARNQLAGRIASVTPGAVNAEVTLTLDGGGEVVAIVTQAAVTQLGLSSGMPATAVFDVGDVILATAA